MTPTTEKLIMLYLDKLLFGLKPYKSRAIRRTSVFFILNDIVHFEVSEHKVYIDYELVWEPLSIFFSVKGAQLQDVIFKWFSLTHKYDKLLPTQRQRETILTDLSPVNEGWELYEISCNQDLKILY